MLLIALSPSDLILIYRASLSLRITLNTIEHSIVSSAMSLSNNNNDALKTTKSIQLLDAYNQLTTGKKPYPPIFNTNGWNNQMLDDKALCNLAPLPAFSVGLCLLLVVCVFLLLVYKTNTTSVVE